MVEIVGEVIVRPTEDESKVKAALRNVIDGPIYVEELGNQYKVLRVRCSDISCLSPLKAIIAKQQIDPAVRVYLRRRARGGAIVILLHKQAAYVGKVSLVDSDAESPLGSIKIYIEGTDSELEEVIEYLTGS